MYNLIEKFFADRGYGRVIFRSTIARPEEPFRLAKDYSIVISNCSC